MKEKYVIDKETLINIADAIREKTSENEIIKTIDFASKIANIDLSTEEYMALADIGPRFSIEPMLPTYSSEEINRVDYYIKYYGGELNGEII